MFLVPKIPLMWFLSDNTDEQIFIYAYMHLLFLDGMKAISKHSVLTVLNKKGKYCAHVHLFNPMLMALSNMKGNNLPIGATLREAETVFGGYLSQDWVSLLRTTNSYIVIYPHCYVRRTR